MSRARSLLPAARRFSEALQGPSAAKEPTTWEPAIAGPWKPPALPSFSKINPIGVRAAAGGRAGAEGNSWNVRLPPAKRLLERPLLGPQGESWCPEERVRPFKHCGMNPAQGSLAGAACFIFDCRGRTGGDNRGSFLLRSFRLPKVGAEVSGSSKDRQWALTFSSRSTQGSHDPLAMDATLGCLARSSVECCALSPGASVSSSVQRWRAFGPNTLSLGVRCNGQDGPTLQSMTTSERVPGQLWTKPAGAQGR